LSELSDHARRNRAEWDRWAEEYFEPGRRAWASTDPSWGIWGIPESQLAVLPDVAGKDALELGCGTAYWSAWLARRGARVVGLDNSPKQLESARLFQQEFGLEFPLLLGSAESIPYPDESFDVVHSEYGASIWADPYLWIPEAARVLRADGVLWFLRNSTLLMLCTPPSGECATERLERPQFGLHTLEWPDDNSVEFHLPHGEWIRILRENGLEIEALYELQAPPDAGENRFGNVTAEWSRRWPSEEIWKARKRP
jgi:SAM-dependent methyltransferase